MSARERSSDGRRGGRCSIVSAPMLATPRLQSPRRTALPFGWASSLSDSLYGSSQGSVVAFVNSPVGASVYWPSHGSGKPQLWPTRSERVASQHHSPWLGTAAVSVRRSEPITWTPPPPPITPTRRQHPGFTATTHTSSLRTPLRRVRTPGEQRCQLVDAVPRSPMTSGLTPGVSQTDLHVPPRVSAQPMHMSPGATRLLHAHPRLDGSSTDHADTTPRSSKARARRLASHLHRMPRGSDLTI